MNLWVCKAWDRLTQSRIISRTLHKGLCLCHSTGVIYLEWSWAAQSLRSWKRLQYFLLPHRLYSNVLAINILSSSSIVIAIHHEKSNWSIIFKSSLAYCLWRHPLIEFELDIVFIALVPFCWLGSRSLTRTSNCNNMDGDALIPFVSATSWSYSAESPWCRKSSHTWLALLLYKELATTLLAELNLCSAILSFAASACFCRLTSFWTCWKWWNLSLPRISKACLETLGRHSSELLPEVLGANSETLPVKTPCRLHFNVFKSCIKSMGDSLQMPG